MTINFLKNIFGTKSEREIEKLFPIVDEVNKIYKSLEKRTNKFFLNFSRLFHLSQHRLLLYPHIQEFSEKWTGLNSPLQCDYN